MLTKESFSQDTLSNKIPSIEKHPGFYCLSEKDFLKNLTGDCIKLPIDTNALKHFNRENQLYTGIRKSNQKVRSESLKKYDNGFSLNPPIRSCFYSDHLAFFFAREKFNWKSSPRFPFASGSARLSR